MSSVTAMKPKLNTLNTSFERVTPEIATKFLEKNTLNRALSQKLVDAYAAEMRRGAWDEDNGETIKIGVDGTVLDGQHRLWAVIESNVTLRFLVVRGVALESFKTIDTGKKRTTGDVCSIAGIKNPNNVAAAATVVWAYKRKKISADGPIRARDFLRSDIVKFCIEHNEKLYRSTYPATGNGCAKLSGSGVLIGLHYLFCENSKAERSDELADAFFQQLGTGIFDNTIEPNHHPIRTLRERLLANRQSVSRLQTGAIAAFIIKAWNAYITKRSLRVLRVGKDEDFPVIA